MVIHQEGMPYFLLRRPWQYKIKKRKSEKAGALAPGPPPKPTISFYLLQLAPVFFPGFPGLTRLTVFGNARIPLVFHFGFTEKSQAPQIPHFFLCG